MDAPQLTSGRYRPDIDGLRAIAVLSVVGFHAFPFFVKGGFVGVDIFFVISGFLISTFIFSNLERKSFGFVEFYSRRIRRIFPALLVVLVACFTFGWSALFADEYRSLGKHIAGGAGFFSNFVLWAESGYFDNAAITKPLLHLWSLGIEEQFYIVWPLLLWLAWKNPRNRLTIIVIIGVASFAYNIAIRRSDPVADFYSPQTRFWELFAGSLLAYVVLYKQAVLTALKTRLAPWEKIGGVTFRDAVAILGALFIALGILLVTDKLYFPGFWAVLPVVGAVLIIGAGTHAWINRIVLSTPVLVWFGLISFPLYLWHWPLLSFARVIESDAPSRTIRIVALLISIALAWLTYKLVELPLRFGKHSNLKTVGLVALMAIVGYVGYEVYKKDGVGVRLKEQSEFLAYFENERPKMRYFDRTDLFTSWRQECAFFDMQRYREGRLAGSVANSVPRDSLDKTCFERDQKVQKAVMLWGDSHAQELAPGLTANLPKDWQVLQVASSDCAPRVDVNAPSTTNQCDQSNYFAVQTMIKSRPDVVVVAQNLGHTTKGFHDITQRLQELGVARIIFVGPTPHWTADLPKLIARKLWVTPRRTYAGIDEAVLDSNAKLQTEFSKTSREIEYANIIEVFCDHEGCMTYIGSDRQTGITTWDYGHLTPIASDFLAKNLLVPLITGGNH